MQTVNVTAQTYQNDPASGSGHGQTQAPVDGVDNVQASTVIIPVQDLTNTAAYLAGLTLGAGSAPPYAQPPAIAASGFGSGIRRIDTVAGSGGPPALRTYPGNAGDIVNAGDYTFGNYTGLYCLVANASTPDDAQYHLTLASSAIPAWVASTSYAVGQFVTYGGSTYQCTTAGLSAASGGPTGAGGTAVFTLQSYNPQWTFLSTNILGGVDGLATLDGEATGSPSAIPSKGNIGAGFQHFGQPTVPIAQLPLGGPEWLNSTLYAPGDVVRATIGGVTFYYQCTSGGMSQSSNIVPSFPTTIGTPFTEPANLSVPSYGATFPRVSWVNIGPAWTGNTFTWVASQPSFAEVGVTIVAQSPATTGPLYMYICTVAGATNASPPTFPATLGATVTESGQTTTWQNIGPFSTLRRLATLDAGTNTASGGTMSVSELPMANTSDTAVAGTQGGTVPLTELPQLPLSKFSQVYGIVDAGGSTTPLWVGSGNWTQSAVGSPIGNITVTVTGVTLPASGHYLVLCTMDQTTSSSAALVTSAINVGGKTTTTFIITLPNGPVSGQGVGFVVLF